MLIAGTEYCCVDREGTPILGLILGCHPPA